MPWLLTRGLRVTGIDLSAEAAAEARQRCPGLEARVAAVRRLPFSAASFAMVFSGSTQDRLHLCQEAALSRSGGSAERPGPQP